MHLILRNATDEIDIHPRWLFDIAGLKQRITQQKRYGRPGAKLMGDEQEDARTASLKKSIVTKNDALFIQELNEIYAIFDPAKAPLYLIDTDTDRRMLVKLSAFDVKSRTDGMERRLEDANLSLIVPNVFWEGLEPIEYFSETGGLANNEILVVNNPSKKLVCYPIIKITSDDANSNINLFNLDTGGILTVGTNAFTAGSEIEIDCQNGLIWLSDGVTRVDILSALADNTGMLFLNPGQNRIKYESAFGPIFISVSFRQKWAF